MGVRTLIWTLIGLLAIYVAIQLLKVGRRPPPAPEAAGGDPPERIAPPDDAGDAVAVAPATAVANGEAGGDRSERVALEMQQLRRDIGQLRSEQEEQRKETARLREQVVRLEQALAGVHAAQQVSPQYREAVMLVRQGLEAEAIAERCGISVAEAALVKSLAQRGEAEGERDEA
ncbi:MAG: DUF2802 domain-containing protein [Rhodocyclaceae bacterium]|nr:DUF2802 domain-containing protein [Rhodocyclaceae bacterium]